MVTSRRLIPDSHHFVRWCKATDVGPGGLPTSFAFYPRSRDLDGLSGNWAEYLAPTWALAVGLLSRKPPLTLSDGGRFVFLQVAAIVDAVRAGSGASPSVIHTPTPSHSSHATVTWIDYPLYHQRIAVELGANVTPANTFARTPQ